MYFFSHTSPHIHKQGFTLVETIVVIAINLLVLTAIIEGVLLFYRYNAYSLAQSSQVYQARRGIQSMVRDLREMTFSDTGTFPLVLMQKHKIGFYSDIDRDNSVEYIVYELIGTTTLQKRIYGATGNPPVYGVTPESTQTISEYVQNISQGTSTFLYYTVNGTLATPTTTVTDITFIRANVIVNIDPVRDPGEFMLHSSAALRNLKEEI